MISINDTKESIAPVKDNTTLMVFRTILNKYHESGIHKMHVQYLTDCIHRMHH